MSDIASRLLCSFAVLAAALAMSGCEGRRFPTEPAPASLQVVALQTPGGATTVPADGFSSLAITASVSPDVVKPGRGVRFRTSSGAFVGAAVEAQIDVPFGPDGRAVAVLRSSARPGAVVVTAQVMDGPTAVGLPSQLQLEFVVPDAGGLFFVDGASSAPADGASVTRFAVQVPQNLPLDARNVAFRTSAGSFDGATNRSVTVAAGTDGQASVLLYSPLVQGVAVLSASIGVFDVETQVTFRPATATSILVTAPARLVEPQTTDFRVTATLVRAIGTPTAGTVVTFRAFDGNDQEFRAFHNVTLSNNTGVATADLRPAGSGAPGNCRIEVTAAGSAAVGRATFQLVRP